jgi:formamidopyrimidine-DNA glycosylase
MPELPDITVYIEALQPRVVGQPLERTQISSPFLLRTAVPPLQNLHGRKALVLRRLGKRIAIGFENELWLVIHLMIAGRLHWGNKAVLLEPGQTARSTRPRRKLAAKQALFEFSSGVLLLTEAGTKRRASIHVVQGEPALRALDPGGIDVLNASLADFTRTLKQENHTLKRALADPHLFSGIGNAYSDEILHRARLSPVALTQKMTPNAIRELHSAALETLETWIERLRAETGDRFPEKVTAFRPEMAVHGKFGQPCPVCGTKVQRIRYAENETNYCPVCQTGGKLLADRSLSLLLKRDWPRTPEELDELRAGHSR